MDRRLLVLALAGFAMGTEAYVYAGHLEALARDLGVGVPAAGWLAASFALTCALTGPLVAGLVGRFDRRTVLVAGLVAIGLLNLAAGFVDGFAALIAIRVACGLAAGLVGPVSSAAAADLAPPERRGRAMAVVLGGVTLAFVLGIPVGSVVGDLGGWRATFLYAGVLALLAAVAIGVVLPPVPGRPTGGLAALRSATAVAARPWLAMTLVGFAATFTVIAYVGPVVTVATGLVGSGIGAMQALIGVGSIAGIVLGARAADGPSGGRVLVVSFLVSAAGLSVYGLLPLFVPVDASAALLSWPRAGLVGVLSAAMVAGSAALFARTPVVQARLVAAVDPAARPVVLALNGSMVFAGQGLGAALGSVAAGIGGIGALGFAGAAVALLGAALAMPLAATPRAAFTR